MRKMIRILMGFWVVVGCFCLITGIYFLFTAYYRDGYTFIAFSGVSGVMYWMNGKRLKVYVDRPAQRMEEEKKKQKGK